MHEVALHLGDPGLAAPATELEEVGSLIALGGEAEPAGSAGGARLT